jgi:antitoxin YefM
LTMTTLPLEEVKTHLSELVGRVHDQHERVTVTVHGRPSAVLLAIEDLERLEETLAILRDADTMRRLDDADTELARGETVSAEELAQVMRRRRSSARGTGVGGGSTSLNELEIHSLTQQIDEALQVTGPDESASDAAGVSRRRLAEGDEW